MNERVPVQPSHESAEAATYVNELVFWLNGQRVMIRDPDPAVLLTDYLHSIGLTGTKVGCGQGGCGACTVMLSHRDPDTGAAVHRAINACLRPLCALDGMMVTTTEGIGNVHEGLDPVQHCIAMQNGTQCGFCTPGFVMTAHAFLQKRPSPSQQEIEDIFGGNLCRCTGYRPILHGFRHPGWRLRCCRGPDPKMPDGSFLRCPPAKLACPDRPGATAPAWRRTGPTFQGQRPGMVSSHHTRGSAPAQKAVRQSGRQRTGEARLR